MNQMKTIFLTVVVAFAGPNVCANTGSLQVPSGESKLSTADARAMSRAGTIMRTGTLERSALAFTSRTASRPRGPGAAGTTGIVSVVSHRAGASARTFLVSGSQTKWLLLATIGLIAYQLRGMQRSLRRTMAA